MEKDVEHSISKVTYRCRRCRTQLFGEKDIVDGGGKCLHCSNKEKPDLSSPSPVLFLQEETYLPWIQMSIEKASWTRGKLSCPKCKGRLGSFDFISPNKCHRGLHIISCIQIVSSRVDRITLTPPIAKIRPIPKLPRLSESEESSPSLSPKTLKLSERGFDTDAMCYRAHQVQNTDFETTYKPMEEDVTGQNSHFRFVSSLEDPVITNAILFTNQMPRRHIQGGVSFEHAASSLRLAKRTLSTDDSMDSQDSEKAVKGKYKEDTMNVFGTSPVDDPILFSVLHDRSIDPDDPFEMRDQSVYRSPRWKRKKKLWRSSQVSGDYKMKQDGMEHDDEIFKFNTTPLPPKNEPVRVTSDHMGPIQARQSPRRYREVDNSSPSFFDFDRISNHEVAGNSVFHSHIASTSDNGNNVLVASEAVEDPPPATEVEPDEFLLTWELGNDFEGSLNSDLNESRFTRLEERKDRNRRKKERRRHKKWMTKQEQQEADCETITKEEFESAAGFSLKGRSVQEVTICPVCLELFYKPCVCSPCNHIFCDPCLRQLAYFHPSNTPCPLCRTSIEVVCLHEAMDKTMQILFPLQTKKRKEVKRRPIYRSLPGKRGLSAWMSPLSRRIWIRQARRGPFWAIQDTARLNAYHDFGRRWCFAIWWWAGAWGYAILILIFIITFIFIISEFVLPKF